MLFNYEDTLKYLYDNLPMFQRIGAAALKNDLSNTIKLCEALDNPQRKFKSIHIAGTNGKGSTAHMLASIFQSADYKTGLYTSPHLKEFTERIRVNGSEVSKSFVMDFVNRVQPLIEEIKPSFFEITVAMAFDYFVQCQVDVAVVEVGLGGRLDSTNVITPELSIITNISWDHKDILGDTLEKIASEKAGIIKEGVTVVISERQPEVEKVFLEGSRLANAPIYFASDNYYAKRKFVNGQLAYDILKGKEVVCSDLPLPLEGAYQSKNIVGVFQSLDVLGELGWKITADRVREGLLSVTSQTGLKGRWQVLASNPLKVCDTGHNTEGIRQVVEQIKSQEYTNLHMVIGVVKDKDVATVLQLLPQAAKYYFCQAKIPRALDATVLAEQASRFGLKGAVFSDVNEAIRVAEQNATPKDLIFIGGSTFIVAEINNL